MSRNSVKEDHAQRKAEMRSNDDRQDNLTCVIVPLPGWTGITSEDSTKKRREFRVQNFEGRSNRQNRM